MGRSLICFFVGALIVIGLVSVAYISYPTFANALDSKENDFRYMSLIVFLFLLLPIGVLTYAEDKKESASSVLRRERRRKAIRKLH